MNAASIIAAIERGELDHYLHDIFMAIGRRYDTPEGRRVEADRKRQQIQALFNR